jgi:hypothetical protein
MSDNGFPKTTIRAVMPGVIVVRIQYEERDLDNGGTRVVEEYSVQTISHGPAFMSLSAWGDISTMIGEHFK